MEYPPKITILLNKGKKTKKEEKTAEDKTRYYKCIGWTDGKAVSHCLNAPCIHTILGFKCHAVLTNREFCRRKMEQWELLEFKIDKYLVKEITIQIPGVNCKVCLKQNLEINDMINVNDDFYVCRSCLDNKWAEILKILFNSE